MPQLTAENILGRRFAIFQKDAVGKGLIGNKIDRRCASKTDGTALVPVTGNPRQDSAPNHFKSSLLSIRLLRSNLSRILCDTSRSLLVYIGS